MKTFAARSSWFAMVSGACLAAMVACGGDSGGSSSNGGSGDQGGSGGGSSGSGGGGSSGSGGGGNAGGSGGGGVDTRFDNVTVDNCARGNTVKDVETKILGASTCAAVACHTPLNAKLTGDSLKISDYKTAGVTARLVDHKPNSGTCSDDFIIDSSNPDKSLLLAKIKDSGPQCPSGNGQAGDKMPLSGTLTADDRTCLENYVKAVAAEAKK